MGKANKTSTGSTSETADLTSKLMRGRYAALVFLGIIIVLVPTLSAILFLSLWPVDPVTTPVDGTSEVARLQTELETVRRYEDRFFQLILWSLTTLLTLTIVVAGFGWFTNTRMYERDVEHLIGTINDQGEDFRAQMRDLISDVTNEIVRMENQHLDALDEIESRFIQQQIDHLLLARSVWVQQGQPEMALFTEIQRLHFLLGQDPIVDAQVDESYRFISSSLGQAQEWWFGEWTNHLFRNIVETLRPIRPEQAQRLEDEVRQRGGNL